MEDIEQPIKAYIIRQFLFDKPAMILDKNVPLIEQGIIDSLGIFLLVAFLEQQFAIKIHPEDIVLENFGTIEAITHLVEARMNS
jgi:acyl carrier protein